MRNHVYTAKSFIQTTYCKVTVLLQQNSPESPFSLDVTLRYTACLKLHFNYGHKHKKSRRSPLDSAFCRVRYAVLWWRVSSSSEICTDGLHVSMTKHVLAFTLISCRMIREDYQLVELHKKKPTNGETFMRHLHTISCVKSVARGNGQAQAGFCETALHFPHTRSYWVVSHLLRLT